MREEIKNNALRKTLRGLLTFVLAGWLSIQVLNAQSVEEVLPPDVRALVGMKLPPVSTMTGDIDTSDRSVTLCEPEEIIIFSCALPKKKTVSLCSSKDASNNTGYMQYRFGRDVSSIELEYPRKQAPAKEFFKYHSSVFAKGGTAAVSFRIGSYRYSLFSTASVYGYSGSGVIVNRGQDAIRVSFLQCISIPTINNKTQSPSPFFRLERLGLPDAGDDISYIGAEPGSDLNQPKQGEPEDWHLRTKH